MTEIMNTGFKIYSGEHEKMEKSGYKINSTKDEKLVVKSTVEKIKK